MLQFWHVPKMFLLGSECEKPQADSSNARILRNGKCYILRSSWWHRIMRVVIDVYWKWQDAKKRFSPENDMKVYLFVQGTIAVDTSGQWQIFAVVDAVHFRVKWIALWLPVSHCFVNELQQQYVISVSGTSVLLSCQNSMYCFRLHLGKTCVTSPKCSKTNFVQSSISKSILVLVIFL